MTELLAQSGFRMGDINYTVFFSSLFILFLAIGIHEYCHAKFADMAGDPTPRIYGRVTLNLFNHFDPIGAIMIVVTSLTGFGIGWGRPVPMDPTKMKNPKWDHFAAVLAGPMSNLVQAVIWAIIFRAVMMTGAASSVPILVILAVLGTSINLSLFFFNLLPLGPLDGMWILGTFLPDNLRDKWVWWNLKYGSILFIGLIIFGQVSRTSIIWMVLGPPVDFLLKLMLGRSLFGG